MSSFFSHLSFPLEFWLAATLITALSTEAIRHFRSHWAISSLLLYLTIAVWYLADAVQQGAPGLEQSYGTALLRLALWQVILFLVAYRVFILIIFRASDDHDPAPFAPQLGPKDLTNCLHFTLAAWALIFLCGLWTADWDFVGVLWPPVSQIKVGMFSHSGVGAGYDFVHAAGGYLYRLICAIFGVLFVLMRGPARVISFGMMVLTWPYFWFDRARNVMLALFLPALLCYFISGTAAWRRKLVIAAVLFCFLNVWFLAVAQNRDKESAAENMLGLSLVSEESSHLGLDMLGELCWMNFFIDSGYYTPNLGERYFAEIVNVVPRTFWPGKPFIGIDYAILRGFGAQYVEQGNEAGVFASVSTGMIGQGVANFGQFFGVIAPALLMAIWTRVLAALWRRRPEVLRFVLFLIGVGLTFNMGRDITLLVLWPFVFGYILVRLVEKIRGRSAHPGGSQSFAGFPAEPPIMMRH